MGKIELIQNEDGKLKKIRPYADITCDTKEDLEFVKAAVDAYLGWRDINESFSFSSLSKLFFRRNPDGRCALC